MQFAIFGCGRPSPCSLLSLLRGETLTRDSVTGVQYKSQGHGG